MVLVDKIGKKGNTVAKIELINLIGG